MGKAKARQRARRWLAFGFGVAVSALFLYEGLKGLRLAEVWQDIRRVHLGWLAAGATIYFLAVWGRTWRWLAAIWRRGKRPSPKSANRFPTPRWN